MATSVSSLRDGSDYFGFDVHCDVCLKRNEQSTAVSYCEVCQEAYCSVCDNVHKNQRATYDHKLLTGDKLLAFFISKRLSASLMICDKHNMPIMYFCKSDKEVCCQRCKITTHKTCDLVEIDKYARQCKPTRDLETTKKQLQQLERSLNAIQTKKTNDKSSVRFDIKLCIGQIKKLRQDLNNKLDKLEENLMTELGLVEDKLNQDLDQHMDLISDSLQQIQDNLKTISQCEKTAQAEVTFVCLKKMEGSIEDSEKIHDYLRAQLDDIEIKFSPDKLLLTALTELNTFGKIEEKGGDTEEKGGDIEEKGEGTEDKSILDLTVYDIKRHDVGCERVQSVVFMPSGHVVLACAHDGLKLLDKDFKQVSQLHVSLFSVVAACKVSDTEVLMSQGDQMQFADVLPEMMAKNALTIGRDINGVFYHKGEIYVTCEDDRDKGEVWVVDIRGKELRKIDLHSGRYEFKLKLSDVKVNNAGDRVFVTDRSTHTVICVDQRGGTIYEYRDVDLRNPLGMFVDSQDNVLVTSDCSNKLHIIHRNGRKHGVLLSDREGIQNPLCVSMRESDGCLAIGQYNDNNFSLVTMKTIVL